MKTIRFFPARLSGAAAVPVSKSIMQRQLICASLADGESSIRYPEKSVFCQDIIAAFRCLEALGCRFEYSAGCVRVIPGRPKNNPVLAVGESASVYRFLMPVCLRYGCPVRFEPEGSLKTRPMEPVLALFREHGIIFDHDSMTVHGALSAGDYSVSGNISGQFVSGMLMALAAAEGSSRLSVTGALVSRPYVEMTCGVLKQFGAKISYNICKEYIIKGTGNLACASVSAEGDWSHGAFWLAAGLAGHRIIVCGLESDSMQGDRQIVSLLEALGGHPVIKPEGISVRGSAINDIDVDASDIPDLVPPLAAAAAAGTGSVTIRRASRLRYKESDRLSALTEALGALGADITQTDDGFVVRGVKRLGGGRADARGDHRIAMALAVAAASAKEPVTVDNFSTDKSYPDFLLHYKQLGGVFFEL